MKKYTLDEVYTADMTAFQRERYNRVADEFEKLFGEKPTAFFSAPGRTEVGGNHTDHNFGCVLAAGVSLDVIAAVAPDNEENVITIKSEGFPMDTVNVDDDAIYEEQKNTSAALIRGMSAGFKKNGHNAGGFKAYATSNVLKGSGLSSSAAYEVLIGTILNGLYNEGEVSAVEIAQIAQFAENVYFGKPSGLMDQMASSVGGFITIDFADEKHPVIEQGLSLALYLAKQALGGEGACRVHGGGFAGTIQAFVPEKKLEAFKAEMERVFGEGSCYVLSIRPVGGVQIDL